MTDAQAAVLPSFTETGVGYAISGTFTAGGRTVAHRQYVTERYVATEFEGSVAIFVASLKSRFIVDRSERLLRPMNVASQRAQLEHIRTVLGSVIVERSEQPCRIDGFTCRLHTLRNESGRISIVAEAWSTKVPGAESTALRHERDFDAGLHPFALPLDPDELVVRSVMRTFANGTEQRQAYRLRELEPIIATPDLFERYLDYPIIGG